MNIRYVIACVLLVAPYIACGDGAEQDDTEEYFVKDDAMIRIDWASEKTANESKQFFESFRGTRFLFHVPEGSVSEIYSLATPIQTASSAQTSATLATASEASMGDAAAQSTPSAPTPAIVGPYVDAGVISYDVKTGIDVGVFCSIANLKQVDPKGDPGLLVFMCTEPMKTQ